ncbi:MAG: hypothetical protein KJZ84_04670 [Bryobacteraceae bacterium]|nr:hypothetical protein [Bryobacteraceae bacterium]
MGEVTFEFGTLIHGRQNQMGTFDADLNPDVRNATTNADLTLYIRINFQRIDPAPGGPATYQDYDGTAVPIRAWRDAEWAQWKARFLRDCRNKWHGKFWLVTPATYNRLNWPAQNPTHRCNLYCRFEIAEQGTTQGAHAVIPVVHVNGNHFFRSHMLLYSNNDLRAERLTRGSNFFTHVHEIGHLIGLDHPGTGRAGCARGGEAICYASADGDDRGVMGRGSMIRAEHARPWTRAASIFTGVAQANWTVSLARRYPQRLDGR